MMPVKIISHSKYVLQQAMALGWEAGARYTNLRDVKHLNSFYFLDIDWKNYDFDQHISAAKLHRPKLTVARDVENADELDEIISEANRLANYCDNVIVVPKDPRLTTEARLGVPKMFRLGYSVPTKYGSTAISPVFFTGDVHLLGGRPDVQRLLAHQMKVVSLDGNRLTFDAKFGDYFDGKKFRPHPSGGYTNCLRDSLLNVNALWI